MGRIPSKLRRQLSSDPYYKTCALKHAIPDHVCEGRVTWEHAIIYAGRQVQERWAIVPICERYHLGDKFIKDIGVWIAFNRATLSELEAFPRGYKAWLQKRRYLNKLYGQYSEPKTGSL